MFLVAITSSEKKVWDTQHMFLVLSINLYPIIIAGNDWGVKLKIWTSVLLYLIVVCGSETLKHEPQNH